MVYHDYTQVGSKWEGLRAELYWDEAAALTLERNAIHHQPVPDSRMQTTTTAGLSPVTTLAHMFW